MTTIEINKKMIYVHGHSGYGTYGNDIVCAAISTLTEATYYYLKATKNKVDSFGKDGEYKIILDNINESGKEIIDTFVCMVDDLISQYPKYIERRNSEI